MTTNPTRDEEPARAWFDKSAGTADLDARSAPAGRGPWMALVNPVHVLKKQESLNYRGPLFVMTLLTRDEEPATHPPGADGDGRSPPEGPATGCSRSKRGSTNRQGLPIWTREARRPREGREWPASVPSTPPKIKRASIIEARFSFTTNPMSTKRGRTHLRLFRRSRRVLFERTARGRTVRSTRVQKSPTGRRLNEHVRSNESPRDAGFDLKWRR